MRKTIVLTLVICLVSSCGWKKTDFLERSGEDGISIVRYDRLQNEYINYNSFSALQKMNTTYIPMTQLLVEDILSLGDMYEEDINKKVYDFFSDTTLLRLMADVEAKYANTGHLEKDLGKAFAKLKEEIPAMRIPRFYTQVSALNESVVINDTLVGISLDKYMGEDYPLYSRFYYGYQCRSMKPERIVPDCLFFYLFGEYPMPEGNVRNLLNLIINQGKFYYIIQQLLGYSSSGDVIDYTDEEKKWCRNNRKKVWEYMVHNRHLYATDPMVIRRYVRQAPFTSYFGEGSPSMIGTWLGLEIVSSYMKHNKDVSIGELLDMHDHAQILNLSHFKP